MKKSVWTKILKVVMAIVSAALGVLGGGAMKWWRGRKDRVKWEKGKCRNSGTSLYFYGFCREV